MGKASGNLEGSLVHLFKSNPDQSVTALNRCKRNEMTRIMIVEDNLRARRALKALISQQAGIEIAAEASNGQEALQTINEQIPDIVLMDVCMPVMDGLEATRLIKAKWPRIRVIILTMYPQNRVEAFETGADAFLLKGCPVEELMSVIRGFQKRETRGNPSISGFFMAYLPPQIMYSPHA
jgi:DNA-binding NarL/FixJ family response regulator